MIETDCYSTRPFLDPPIDRTRRWAGYLHRGPPGGGGRKRRPRGRPGRRFCGATCRTGGGRCATDVNTGRVAVLNPPSKPRPLPLAPTLRPRPSPPPPIGADPKAPPLLGRSLASLLSNNMGRWSQQQTCSRISGITGMSGIPGIPCTVEVSQSQS